MLVSSKSISFSELKFIEESLESCYHCSQGRRVSSAELSSRGWAFTEGSFARDSRSLSLLRPLSLLLFQLRRTLAVLEHIHRRFAGMIRSPGLSRWLCLVTEWGRSPGFLPIDGGRLMGHGLIDLEVLRFERETSIKSHSPQNNSH
jgi:hypothetical protein